MADLCWTAFVFVVTGVAFLPYFPQKFWVFFSKKTETTFLNSLTLT